jgi:hypothetical protein
MKIILKTLLIFILIVNVGCDKNNDKPRIAIAGLAIESSTFSPAKTIEEDFKARVGEKYLHTIRFYLKTL